MKRNIVIATVAAAALVTGGTATALATTGDDESGAKRSSVRLTDHDRKDDDRSDDGKDDDRRDDAEDAAENTAEAKAAKVTAADAIRAALAKTPGTAVSAELDEEDGALVWGVDILKGDTWHDVEVDPGTGKVLGSWIDQDDDGDAGDDGDDAADAARVNAALKGASTSAEDAARAGAAKGKVTSVDLDDDGKAGAWGVETTGAKGAESEWHVDLKTGKVTADRHDGDRADQDADGSDD